MTLLEATDLRKHFGALAAVDGLSLTVEPGEAYGLVGPDGAGKTTTMRLMVGALSLEGGSVTHPRTRSGPARRGSAVGHRLSAPALLALRRSDGL